MGQAIEGVIITRLKQFPDARGTVKHMIKSSDIGFRGFGEVYCSTLFPKVIKGWHLSNNTTINYVVLKGMIKLVLFDDRDISKTRNMIQEILVGDQNYVRVAIPPGIWRGFKCLGPETAMICDLINIPYDQSNSHRLDLNNSRIPYNWGQ